MERCESAIAADHAAAMHGTDETPTRRDMIKFTPLRAFRGGMEGSFVVNAKGLSRQPVCRAWRGHPQAVVTTA